MSSDDELNNDSLAELLREAGPRPAAPALDQPPLDLESLAAPALAVWQAQQERRETRRRRSVALAAAAGLLMAIAVFVLWRSGSWTPAPSGPVVGRVIAQAGVDGPLDVARTGHDPAFLDPTFLDPTFLDPTFLDPVVQRGRVLRASADPPRWLTLELSSGHRLRLDAGTELLVSTAEEVELVRGAIYIEAVPAPLRVRAGDTVTEHIGTRYAVRHEPSGAVSVGVREGRVRVRRADDSVELERAQRVVVTTAPLEVEPWPTHGAEWAWTRRAAPAFQTDGATLEAVLRWIERESGRRVEVDPLLLLEDDGEPFDVSGEFGHYPIEEALSVVLDGAGLAYRIDGDVVRVSAAP